MDPAALARFFSDLPTPIDHVMVTAGRPTYVRLADMDLAQMRRALDEHLLLALQVARHAANKVRPGGTLLLMGGTGARRPAIGLALVSTVTAALPALTASLALELAPVRVDLIAPASSTHRCRRRCLAMSSTTVAISFGRRCPSGAWSDRPTSPRSPSTS